MSRLQVMVITAFTVLFGSFFVFMKRGEYQWAAFIVNEGKAPAKVSAICAGRTIEERTVRPGDTFMLPCTITKADASWTLKVTIGQLESRQCFYASVAGSDPSMGKDWVYITADGELEGWGVSKVIECR